MNIDPQIAPKSLENAATRVFEIAAAKVRELDQSWDPSRGTPVCTAAGKYTTRGWTEWTQGFQYGCALLAFDATDDRELFEMGRQNTLKNMAPHVSHVGVHDHGFNNISTYGNLRRLMLEGRIERNDWELNFYEMALKASGAVQAARWTAIPKETRAGQTYFSETGYIHSFNGPHSLFSDTIRSVRSLMLAWQLGHSLMGENDRRISLLGRGCRHCHTTARFNIFYGEGRDAYDVPAERGRVAHESIFNITDSRYRCPSTQQGYSPFSTWTRGLAWIVLGFTEELEFLATLDASMLRQSFNFASTRPSVAPFEFGRLCEKSSDDWGDNKNQVLTTFCRAAAATADWWLTHSFADGMVYWDSGAPGIPRDNDYSATSDPYNDHEPIDSSAAAIAAQGLLRLGRFLGEKGTRYTQAGLSIAKTLFAEPYLSIDPNHQGLLLHSVYHRPNGWDHIPPGRKIPCGESSMWGDYHLLELALMIRRMSRGERYYAFFDQQKV